MKAFVYECGCMWDEKLPYCVLAGHGAPFVRATTTDSHVHRFLHWVEEANQSSTKTNSVLQDWVMAIPLREQGTLLTAVRGCDFEPKTWSSQGVAYSPGRRLTAFIRWCFMNPADPREIDREEGAFFMSKAPDPFKPSEFGHLPQHWYSHAMHSLEVIAYRHPDGNVAATAYKLYYDMVHNNHLNVESKDQMIARLSEDRIAKGTVVS